MAAVAVADGVIGTSGGFVALKNGDGRGAARCLIIMQSQASSRQSMPMMKLISLLLLPLGITTVLGSSTTIVQNLIRGSALKCLADLGGGLREWCGDRKFVFAAVFYFADTRT